jgi:hypothetical protein
MLPNVFQNLRRRNPNSVLILSPHSSLADGFPNPKDGRELPGNEWVRFGGLTVNCAKTPGSCRRRGNESHISSDTGFPETRAKSGRGPRCNLVRGGECDRFSRR